MAAEITVAKESRPNPINGMSRRTGVYGGTIGSAIRTRANVMRTANEILYGGKRLPSFVKDRATAIQRLNRNNERIRRAEENMLRRFGY